MRALALITVLASCGATNVESPLTGESYVGLHEVNNRAEIETLVGVDPVRIEWCAAFVNSMLHLEGIPGSESVSSAPLTARSFLAWGVPIPQEEIQRGDIVVFSRGNWRGHVGFYVETVYENSQENWVILGGNQSDTISYDLYDPKEVISIRRYEEERNG